MNIALHRPMTIDEFLEWEERQVLRYEFDGFQPIAMAGGTAAHAAILRNILYSLTGRLRGNKCQPYGSELKLLVAGRIRYPDAFVVCTALQPQSTIVTDPVVVFEVLSGSTAHEDLNTKNAEYRATLSIMRYIVLHQTHAGAIIFTRKGDDWVTNFASGEGALLSIPEIGVEIPLAELYQDVELTGAPALD